MRIGLELIFLFGLFSFLFFVLVGGGMGLFVLIERLLR